MGVLAILVAAALASPGILGRTRPVPKAYIEGNHRARDHYVRDVYTNYPYTGPAVPIGDPVDQTVNGNSKGFPRLMEPPAVWPSSPNATNNINTIAMAYIPGGMNIHFSTPYGLGGEASVNWGTDQYNLKTNVKGSTKT